MNKMMITMTLRQHVSLALLSLLFCLLWFEFTPTDLWLQSFFFNSAKQQWLWNSNEVIGQWLLYDGIKLVLIVFGVGLIIALIASRKVAAIKPYRRGLRIVILSLILVPACVSGLKAISNVPCPRALQQYGGKIPYAGNFGTAKTDTHIVFKQQRCFPAGHASGGFALLALPFLFTTARSRKWALATGLTVGWTMGNYKMLIGDHFISHTVVTMLLAWLIISLIVGADRVLFKPTQDELHNNAVRS